MLPSEIRELILAEHRRVAPLLDAVEDCARLALIGRCSENDLRKRGWEMESVLLELLDEERRMLHPELLQVDAWGEVRARNLEMSHRQRRAMLAHTREAAAGGVVSPRQLAERLLHTVAAIRADMRREEQEFLSPDLLRDDLVVAAQSDG